MACLLIFPLVVFKSVICENLTVFPFMVFCVLGHAYRKDFPILKLYIKMLCFLLTCSSGFRVFVLLVCRL